jgi:hypothetical protein
MHPSPDHMQFALIALSAIYVAERLWLLIAKIIAFFDKRAAANTKIQVPPVKEAESKQRTRQKLPLAAGGPLPKPRSTSYRRDSHAPTQLKPTHTVSACAPTR